MPLRRVGQRLSRTTRRTLNWALKWMILTTLLLARTSVSSSLFRIPSSRQTSATLPKLVDSYTRLMKAYAQTLAGGPRSCGRRAPRFDLRVTTF